MSSGITFSGVGSGLPVANWITAMVSAERKPVDALYTKQTTLNTEKSTLSSIAADYSALQSSVQKLTDGNLASSFDLFAARTATVSDSKVATVSAVNNSAVQQISLSVDSLATSTKATSSDLSQPMDGTELFTKVANKQGKLGSINTTDSTVYGTFSMYVDGKINQFTIKPTDTVNNIVKQINDKFKPNGDPDYANNPVTASVTGGKLSITYNNNAVSKVTLGSSSDTANFFNIMKLSTVSANNNGDGTSSFTSPSAVSKVDFSGNIVGNGANLNVDPANPITAGTFTIGKTVFTIDANTTLSDLVSNINKDDGAGVIAQLDATTNKLVLISKSNGKTAIDLENGTSNFLNKVGLISDTGDSLTSQTLGNNAFIHINGAATALEVNSNTVNADISGVQGLTINLSKVTTSTNTDGSKTDTPVTINVNQDTTQISTALNNFVSAYNTTLTDVASQTAKGQPLHNQFSLVSLENTIRSMATNNVAGLKNYDSLGMIGLTTGSVGKSAKDTSANLTLDSTKFLAALKANPSEVRTLLIGDAKTGTKGIFQNLEDKLTSVLDPVNGYFDVTSSSIDTSIADTNNSITKGEAHITDYKAMITKQFADMDNYISQMKSQSSSGL